jgi:D-alanyl-D-alanine carboxypeptidase/D-alanyl-D-alanine-endopeptidase (penicillin-binding protein 4)
VRSLLIAALRAPAIRYVPAALPAPAGAPVLSAHFESPPLRTFLRPFLKESINLIGDALFRTLGARLGDAHADLWDAGRAVATDFFARRRLDAVIVHDGSGVSRENRVTPATVTELLLQLRVAADFPTLWDALPIAGVDGTLAHRMKGTAAEGVLRAKTGTLSGVYNLSGYVPDVHGEFVPFVLLSRTKAGNGDVAHAAEDRVGAALARALGH